MSEKNSEKRFLELTADTAINGVLAGIKLEAGVVLAVVSLGTQTKTLEEGYDNLKKSMRGGHEMGRRLGKKNLTP